MDALAQVNVGGIISNAMDGALKKIIQDLADAAAGKQPLVATAAFSGLDQSMLDKIASVPQEQLLEFLGCYSGLQYNMSFLPSVPALTVSQIKPVTQVIAAPEAAAGSAHVMGGSISVSVGGSWSF